MEQKADSIIKSHEAFIRDKDAFVTQLDTRLAAVTSTATEQARNILLAMSGTDAVAHLMELDLEENVVLLKGMPEKKIASILGAFSQGDIEQFKRGQDIFKAISVAGPASQIIGDQIQTLSPPAANTAA